jgi:hypothetical protein
VSRARIRRSDSRRLAASQGPEGPGLDASSVRQLQRSVGNRGMSRLLGSPLLQRQPDPRSDEEKQERLEELKKQAEACARDKTRLLPKVGVVEHINRDVALDQILGKERSSFEKLILADNNAHEFVCEAGVGAVMALFYNKDYKNRLNVARAKAAFKAHPTFYTVDAFDTARETKAFLEKTYRISIERGDKAWSTDDIGLLAEALGRLTDRETPLIAGYKFLRWSNKCFQMTAKDSTYVCDLKDWSTCGFHLPEVITGEYTITMYDCYKTDPEEFEKKKLIGRPGAETIVHEIGHAMEFGKLRVAIEAEKAAKREYQRLTKLAAKATGSEKASLEAKVAAAKTALDNAGKAIAAASPSSVDQFVKLWKGKPPLPDATNGTTEAFAEAFVLFKLAPKRLRKANRPLYDWFKKGGFV